MSRARPYIVSWIRKRQLVRRPRYYTKIENGMAQILRQFFWVAQPGDVFEIAHADFGFQIATVKVRIRGFQIELASDIKGNKK